MRTTVRIGAVAGAAWLLIAGPAAAAARRGVLLRSVAPTSAAFHDRVLPGTDRKLEQAVTYRRYAAGDESVRVSVASAYATTPGLAQSYASFLGSLPHGTELAALKVRIVTPAEVGSLCGGKADVLACYDPASQTMVVPGQEISGAPGVTTSYVVAHEYGHHIAAHRSDAPFPALDYGPKRWASRELVCARTAQGTLAPGDEAAAYAANPGEAWAETYAQLTYPGVAWTYSPLLAPTAASLAAARADVSDPWTGPVTRTFHGRLSARTPRRSFHVVLHLDGALRIRLRGPAAARYDLRVLTRGRTAGRTSGHGSRDTLRFAAACRVTQAQPVTVRVLRRAGAGRFSLAVSYAG